MNPPILTKTSWTKKELLIYLAVLATGILLRFLFLDIRALHHDESLHAQYGHYFFDSPLEKYYRYDPLLHGPLLYHLLPFSYWIFGLEQWALRIIPATAGSLLLFLPILLKKHFSSSMIIVITAIAALSPTYTYWSRFLNHDMLVILFMSITLALFLHPTLKAKIRLPLLASVVSLQYCLKANAYLHLVLLLLLLFFDYLYHRKSWRDSLIAKFGSYLFQHKYITALSCLLGLFIFAYFYTAGFKYPQGFLDGLYRESLSYWWNQHRIERISGPFIYHFLVLFIYEPIYFFALSFIPFLIFKHSLKRGLLTIACTLVLCGLLSFLPTQIKSDLLKLKIPLDALAFSSLLIFFISFCSLSYKQKNERLGLVAFLFGSTTTIYSFAGEKVPWLSLYPLFFAFGFLILLIHQYWGHRIFRASLLLCLIVGFSKNLFINFVRPGSSSEIISQVHTNLQFESSLKKLDLFIESNKRSFLAHPQVLWPTSWYMYYSGTYQHIRGNQPLSRWDYILAPSYDREYLSELHHDYDYTLIGFRQWWEPDYQQLSFPNLLSVFFTHQPWNSPELSYVYLFERKSFNKEFLEQVKTAR